MAGKTTTKKTKSEETIVTEESKIETVKETSAKKVTKK